MSRPRTQLRAVNSSTPATPAEAPASKRVAAAAKDGSTRDLLVAMRDRIAVAVENENTPARDLASLTKRLMEVVRDIEAVDARAAEEARESAEHPDEAWDSEAL